MRGARKGTSSRPGSQVPTPRQTSPTRVSSRPSTPNQPLPNLPSSQPPSNLSSSQTPPPVQTSSSRPSSRPPPDTSRTSSRPSTPSSQPPPPNKYSTTQAFANADPLKQFEQYLASNELPIQEECTLLTNILSSKRLKIAEIDKRIQELTEEKRALKASIDLHSPIIAPIRRVPPELLLQIFSLYISFDAEPCLPESYFRALSHFNFAPWLLGHVSQGWRRIVLQSPSCWSKVNISWETKSLHRVQQRQRHYDVAYRLLLEHMARSGDQPLQVHLDAYYVCSANYPKFLTFILDHQDRWQKLVVYNAYGSSSKDVVRAICNADTQRQFALLEEIEIESRVSFHISQDIHAPKLRRVLLWELSPWPDSFSWSKLTVLRLQSVEKKHIMLTLPHLSALQVLYLRTVTKLIGTEPRIPPSYPFPCLKHLSVGKGYAPVLNAIKAPFLRHLCILRDNTRGIRQPTDMPPLLNLLLRSCCTISSLEGSFLTSVSALDDLMTASRHVTTAHIELLPSASHQVMEEIKRPARASHLLDALRSRHIDGKFAILPALERVTLHMPYEDGIKVRYAFLDLLELRYGSGGTGVHLQFAELKQPSDWQKMRADQFDQRVGTLRHAGLNLKVSDDVQADLDREQTYFTTSR